MVFLGRIITYGLGVNMSQQFLLFQGVKIVFKVGLALLKYCHDDLVRIQDFFVYSERNSHTSPAYNWFSFCFQVKLPFEKLVHALRNFPEGAMDPDTVLPMANSIKVLSFSLCGWCVFKQKQKFEFYLNSTFYHHITLIIYHGCSGYLHPFFVCCVSLFKL